jgi:phenylacetate-CoA ligase
MGRADRARHAAFSAKQMVFLRADAAALRDMVALERLSAEELNRLQAQRSLAIARFAATKSPHYQAKYRAAGISPNDLVEPAAFESLPLLEKPELRESVPQIRSAEATDSNTRKVSTGGSTGEPLKLWHDLRARHRALSWRQFSWWNVNPADNVAHVWRDTRSGLADITYRAKWWPSRSINLNSEDIAERSVREFLVKWERVKPQLVLGYTGAAHDLASVLYRMGAQFHPPRAVGVTASGMTPEQQSFMSEVFGAPVYDHYRAVEVPFIAGECAQQKGMHVMSDVRRVEIIGDDGAPVPDGVEGDIVLTDLLNRAFPIVRYRIGDRGRFLGGGCSCGRSLPLLDSIAGRTDDSVRLPSGRTLTPVLGSTFAAHPGAARQYQLHQHADYSITLRCIAGPAPDAEQQLRSITEELAIRYREEVPVRLEIVDNIPHNRGKTRVVISEAPTQPGSPAHGLSPSS